MDDKWRWHLSAGVCLELRLDPRPACPHKRPVFSEIQDSLRGLYHSDPRPWLVGFSGVARIEEFSENNRAHGLPAELKKSRATIFSTWLLKPNCSR